MAQDSTIRLRQINQSEISGFVSQIVSSILSNSETSIVPTGKLTGSFYPLESNPNGYLQSGAFVSRSDLDSAIVQENIYIAENYWPANLYSGMDGQTGAFVTINQTGNFATKNELADFYPVSNPAGYISSVNSIAMSIALG